MSVSKPFPLLWSCLAFLRAVVPITFGSFWDEENEEVDEGEGSSDQSHITLWLRRPLKKISFAAENIEAKESLSRGEGVMFGRGVIMLRRIRSCFESGLRRRKLARWSRTRWAAVRSSRSSVEPHREVGSAEIESPEAVRSIGTWVGAT